MNKAVISAKYILATAISAVAVTAAAQTPLVKEIVVERDVEPAERAANRPASVSPAIMAPRVQLQRPQVTEYAGTGTVRRIVPMLEPAAWADTFAVDTYRGYLMGGYLPLFNIGASAGYRIVDKPNTTLGAWLQYDGDSYKMGRDKILNTLTTTADAGDKVTLSSHNLAVGLDLTQRFKAGTLTASGKYTLGMASQPWVEKDYDQTATGASLRVGWNTTVGHVGAFVSHFGYSKRTPGALLIDFGRPSDIKPAAETVFGLDVSLMKYYGNHGFGIDIAATGQALNGNGYFKPGMVSTEIKGPNLVFDGDKKTSYGVITLIPRYRLNKGIWHLNAGIRADIGLGKGNNIWHFTPDLRLTVAPTQQFAAWINIEGEDALNTLEGLYGWSSQQLSALTYGRTYFYDGVAGITVGPFYGASLSLHGGISAANSWLSPAISDGIDFLFDSDVDAWHFGANLDWQLRDIIKISLGFEKAPNGDDKAYYRWRDRASTVIEASLTVRPVKPLSIGLNWQSRGGRHAMQLSKHQYITGLPYMGWAYEHVALGRVNDLGLTASYEVSPTLSVFADVHNLLCKRWMLLPQVESASMHGLAGVSLKF